MFVEAPNHRAANSKIKILGAAMAAQFKVGDIVQLKSGGPLMTVRSTPTVHSHFYTCQWFAGKKLESGTFSPESLQAEQKAE